MNYFKVLAITIFLSVGFTSYGQNNMYMVTERLDNQANSWAFDSIYVTTPAGVTTVSNIPHWVFDQAGHNSQLNLIFNSITSQGYVMLETGVSAWNAGNYPSAGNNILSVTWLFKQP